jgi:hypothetical protein
MEINKAVQRLGWRFQQASKRADLSFVINQNDIEALKAIDLFVVKKQRANYQKHELFAKLYINYVTELTDHYGTSLCNPLIRRRMDGILRQPIQQMIEKSLISLNDNEKYKLMEECGIELKHPAIQSEEERTNHVEKLKKALTDSDNRQKFMGEE